MFFTMTVWANELKIIEFIVIAISIFVMYLQDLSLGVFAAFANSTSSFNDS